MLQEASWLIYCIVGQSEPRLSAIYIVSSVRTSFKVSVFQPLSPGDCCDSDEDYHLSEDTSDDEYVPSRSQARKRVRHSKPSTKPQTAKKSVQNDDLILEETCPDNEITTVTEESSAKSSKGKCTTSGKVTKKANPLTQEEIVLQSRISQAASITCKHCNAEFDKIKELTTHIREKHYTRE